MPGRKLALLLASLFAAFWPALLQAQGNADPPKDAFDIAIIIENRVLPNGETREGASEAEREAARRLAEETKVSAKAEIDLLFEMLDAQMLYEHIIRLDRPTIEVICDIFGCPDTIKPPNVFPPLLWQITREREARLFVYYVGNGRVEGVERQLLFRRTDNENALRNGDVTAYSVEWLHAMLDEANAEETLVMLDTSFAPRPLPCAGEDPHLINDSLRRVRQTYRRIARDHWNRTGSFELSATTPVQPPHCDRFDEVLLKIQEPLFTKFLLKGIVDGEADDDEDRLIEFGELADYLDDRIKRAARFQWGRVQNVRAIGSPGKVIAGLDKRPLQEWNQDVLDRVEEDEDEEDEENEDEETEPGITEPGTLEPSVECGPNSTSKACHPCVIDPEGPACIDHCDGDANDTLCSREDDLTSTTDEDQPDDGPIPDGIEVVPFRPESDGAGANPSPACRIAVDTISPYLNRLIERFPGDNNQTRSCAWARGETEIELTGLSRLLYLFQPIVWPFVSPFVMPIVKDGASCALDCGGIRTIASPPPPKTEPPKTVGEVITNNEPPLSDRWDDLRRLICDADYEETPFQTEQHRPQPFYIGIPRWMPGTRMISDLLRNRIGCPSPPPDPELPILAFVAIEPIEVCPSGTVPATRLNKLLADWPSYDTTADLEISGIYLRDLDFGEVDSTLPIEKVCVPQKPEPDPPIEEPIEEPPIEQPDEGLFVDSTINVRWLQSALTVDNRNPGPIDGSIGDKTREAIQSWRDDNGRENKTGDLTDTEFQKIMEAFGKRFHQIFERAGPLSGIENGSGERFAPGL